MPSTSRQLDPQTFWDRFEQSNETRPGCTEAEIETWEVCHKLQFPASLRPAYLIQNGGLIAHGEVELNALNKISFPDAHLREQFENSDAGIVDFSRVVLLSSPDDSESILLLIYDEVATAGLEVLPARFYTDLVIDDRVPLERFLLEQSHADPSPGFDWSETDRLDVCYFHETWTPAGELEGLPEVCVLGRLNGQLVYYQRSDPHDEQSKSIIEEPLDADVCRIDAWDSRLPRRRSLELASEHPGKCLTLECRKLKDDTWKNTNVDTEMVFIPSMSKARLNQIRIALLGERLAKQVSRSHRLETLWAVLAGTAVVLFCFPFLAIILVGVGIRALLRRLFMGHGK